MSYKYTLRDVLLEESEKEFYSIKPDFDWERSENHKKAINKLFEDNTSIFEKIGSSPLYKGLSIAAAVVLILGALIAIRPVREAVASLFKRTPDTTETGPQTEPGGTDTVSGIITEPADTTGANVTEPADENGKPPAHLCVTCGDVTVYPDVYLMWTEKYDDKSGGWLSGDGFGTDDHVPLLHGNKISIGYEGYDGRASVSVRLDGNDELVSASVDEVNTFLGNADKGVYRFTVSYLLTGRLIDGKYEKTCFQYLFDVEVNNGQETVSFDDKSGSSPVYLSVKSGNNTIYPVSYPGFSEIYDDEEKVWQMCDPIGIGNAENVPLIRYTDSGIFIDYDDRFDGPLDVSGINVVYYINDEEYRITYDDINAFLSSADDGVYRFAVSFIINGRYIDNTYERSEWIYPFDVEVKKETEPVFEDWDKLDIQGRVERAVYEITHYGINYQRFRYLCGDEHEDRIYDDGDGYYLGYESQDNFTYGYFLDLYDTETDPMRKQLMFVYISSFLTGTWNDEEHAVPYTTHHYPRFDYFKAEYLPHFDASWNTEGDKWLHKYYYDALCKYARYMTEDEVKTKYAPSYKLLKKYGFNDYADSAKTFEQKAQRTVNEFVNMALSVKYGIAVSDPSSNVYFRFDEGADIGSVYDIDDAIYTALLKYYTKEELSRFDSAPAVYEQREGIKTIDKWKEYFTSLTTKSIADEFVKESKYFLTTSDGLVLTSDLYYFFNTNNLNTPYVSSVNVGSGTVFMYDVDGNKYYTVQFKEENGKVKIVGGTLVTEWLYRTLSPDECAIKDVIMDAEKLFRVIRYGIVSDFRSYSHDITYSIEYGNNKDLPDGLEEKLDLMSTYETSDGKKHYLSNRVIQFSYALYTYDNWIKYFSKILPEKLVREYIKETPYFLIVGESVYLLEGGLQSWYEIDYGTMKYLGEKDGITTVAAVLTGAYGPEVPQNGFEVTFELEKSENGYKIVGGTFIDVFMDGGANKSKAAHAAYELIRVSDTLLCADTSVICITEYIKNDEDDLPASFKDDKSRLTFPIYTATDLLDFDCYSNILDFWTSEKIKNSIMKETDVMKWVKFDYQLFPALMPSNSEYTIRPVFAETNSMTVYGLKDNMKNYKETDDTIEFSLDFILNYKNGTQKNATYTFLFDKADCRIIGGTFIEEHMK